MLARRQGALLPPRSLLAQTSSPSPSEFAAGGAVALQCCRLGALTPGDRILDIGSGVGRVAIPLTGYLDSDGAYVGVDMWRQGVQWCSKAITPRFPNFTFRFLDVRHDRLNPSGTAAIEATPLPVADAAFDFVMLGAINHLTARQLRALVGEAGRALRPGGTYVGTWFVFDDRSRALLPPVATAVACHEEAMEEALAAASLHRRALYPGRWRGAEHPEGFQTFQDVVVATKAESEGTPAPGGDGMPPVTSSS
jgi:SAM-dependent methyltransferase